MEMESKKKLLDRAKMRELLSDLGALIAKEDKIVEIAVYGGSALVLQFDFRDASEDIDYIPMREDDGLLKKCATEVAQRHGLPSNWFSDAMQMNPLSDRGDRQVQFYGDFPHEAPGLRVFVASAEYIFAMKVLAMRSSAVARDVEDVWNLWDHLGVQNAEQALEICQAYYPGYNIPRRHVLLLQDIERFKRNDQPYSPLLGW